MSIKLEQNFENLFETSTTHDSNCGSSYDTKKMSYVIPFRRHNAGLNKGAQCNNSTSCNIKNESKDSGYFDIHSFPDVRRTYGRDHSSIGRGFPWKRQHCSYPRRQSQVHFSKAENETMYWSTRPFIRSNTFDDDGFDQKENMFGEGIYRPKPQSRRGSPSYALRTFVNWAKVKVIQQAVPDSLEKKLTVVDLGCCKGVDLKKWAHSKVDKVYLVDDDEENLEECRARFKEIDQRWPERFQANFLLKDYIYDTVTLTEKVDVVSCHFFVQKAFVTKEEASRFAKNVSNLLKDGGHFVVSIVNAKIVKALVEQSEDKKCCGNGVYSVELELPLTLETSEFGVRMIFRVHDKFYEEFLVEMSTLERVLGEEGMTIVWRRSFSELYEEATRNENERKLLNMMGVTKDGVLLMNRPQMQTASLYEAAMFKKISGN